MKVYTVIGGANIIRGWLSEDQIVSSKPLQSTDSLRLVTSLLDRAGNNRNGWIAIVKPDGWCLAACAVSEEFMETQVAPLVPQVDFSDVAHLAKATARSSA